MTDRSSRRWLLVAVLGCQFLLSRSFVTREIAWAPPAYYDQAAYLAQASGLHNCMLDAGNRSCLTDALVGRQARLNANGVLLPVLAALLSFFLGASRSTVLQSGLRLLRALAAGHVLPGPAPHRQPGRGLDGPGVLLAARSAPSWRSAGSPTSGWTSRRPAHSASTSHWCSLPGPSPTDASRSRRRWAAGALVLMRYLTAVYIAGIWLITAAVCAWIWARRRSSPAQAAARAGAPRQPGHRDRYRGLADGAVRLGQPPGALLLLPRSPRRPSHLGQRGSGLGGRVALVREGGLRTSPGIRFRAGGGRGGGRGGAPLHRPEAGGARRASAGPEARLGFPGRLRPGAPRHPGCLLPRRASPRPASSSRDSWGSSVMPSPCGAYRSTVGATSGARRSPACACSGSSPRREDTRDAPRSPAGGPPRWRLSPCTTRSRRHCERMGWLRPRISTDVISEELVAAGLPLTTLYYERQGVLLGVHARLGGSVLGIAPAAARAALEDSDIVLLSAERHRPVARFPFEKDMDGQRADVHALVQRRFVLTGATPRRWPADGRLRAAGRAHRRPVGRLDHGRRHRAGSLDRPGRGHGGPRGVPIPWTCWDRSSTLPRFSSTARVARHRSSRISRSSRTGTSCGSCCRRERPRGRRTACGSPSRNGSPRTTATLDGWWFPRPPNTGRPALTRPHLLGTAWSWTASRTTATVPPRGRP